jgi:two-component system nitrogen regulation response regulator GlnG
VSEQPLHLNTTQRPGKPDARDAPSLPTLVLAHHPMLARVGETFPLGHVPSGTPIEVARLTPVFTGSDGRPAGPLDDPFVSRKPLRVTWRDGVVELVHDELDITVGGIVLPPRQTRRVERDELTRGVAIVMAERVVLWLTTAYDPRGVDELGMHGGSAAIHELRAQIRAAVTGARGPILVRGETGAGKELVARAIHAAGPRVDGPYVVVNVAAIPAAVAAAELFGHERGAFTGASERRAGYFERAHGGVLFLDEIGDLPEAVQPVMLRALDAGQIQPIGGTPRAVDVLVVAATDANLAAAERGGRFRAPLLHRLTASVIDVPPLRVRGADVASLLARMLCELLPGELADRTTDPSPWLPAPVIAALLVAPWPGNVRQLRNVAQRLAAIARSGRTARLADVIDGEAEPEVVEPEVVEPEVVEPAPPTAIDDDRLLATLRRHRFQLTRTAEELGISRTHLDALIARSGRIRKANQLTHDDIAACMAELGDDVDAMAARLEVSPRGLQLRMKQLGLRRS